MSNRHLLHLLTLFGILFAATSVSADMEAAPRRRPEPNLTCSTDRQGNRTPP